MIVRASFSVNLRTWCFRDDCCLVIIGHKILQHRAAQPVAGGPHLAHEAVLCGPQDLFARLISSWKGLQSIFWQIKRSKPKSSSVWFSWNQIWFAAKTFFLVFTYFWGQIPKILTEINTDLRRRPFFLSSLTFGDRYPKYWPKWAPIFVQQTCNYLELNLGKNAFGPQ